MCLSDVDQAVIDVGSNSVRLLISKNNVTQYKLIEVTRISQDMKENMLTTDAIQRTALAVNNFIIYAREKHGVTPIIFATEAVRKARNREEFLNLIPLEVDVIEGHLEGKIGYMGACNNRSGKNLVIDIGGASTEIVVGEGENIVYSVSCPFGVVRLKEWCGEDELMLEEKISEIIPGYGDVPSFDRAIVIGGTGLNLVSAINGIVPYDPKLVDGARITRQMLEELLAKLAKWDYNERKKMGVDEKRVDIIFGGCKLLMMIMDYIKANEVLASESDNLEGYLRLKG